MKKRLSKSILSKSRPRIKNESKQDIIKIEYASDVENGKRKICFDLPPKRV